MARSGSSPRSLVGVLRSEVVIDAIRKELRRQTGHNCENDELLRVISTEVIRPDLA